jgi:hypothetical protein
MHLIRIWIHIVSFVFGMSGMCISIVLQLLYRKYSGNFLVNMLGKWKESEYSSSGQVVPVGGLVYYITPPSR